MAKLSNSYMVIIKAFTTYYDVYNFRFESRQYIEMKVFLKIANYSLISFYGVLNLIFCFSSEKAIAEETISNTTLANLVNPTSSKSREQTSKNQKPKFPNRGIPTGRRRGGTSRSECSQTNRSLTAIVPGVEIPETNTTNHNSLSEPVTQTSFADSKSFLTRTLEEYPTFWVYVPKLVDSSIKGEFILQDDKDNDIYRTYLNLPNRGGIINISLPNRPQNSLKIGQKYHWYVKIFCNKQNESAKYVFVDAWLERIAIYPKLERQLNGVKLAKLSPGAI